MCCKWTSSLDNTLICRREAHDESGYCLFHKPNKTKIESVLMNKCIEEYLVKDKDSDLVYYEQNKIVIDFRGFIFSYEYTININQNIGEDLIIEFSECIFNQKCNFNNYNFKGDVYFDNTKFNDFISFENSTFYKNTIFYNTKFNEKNIKHVAFLNTKFKGQNLIIKNCENIPKLDGIKLSKITKFALEDLSFSKKAYVNARTAYRIAANQASIIGDYEKIGQYYYRERVYGSKLIQKSNFASTPQYISTKLFDLISKYVIGYGERPWNLFIVSFIIVNVFAIIYMITGIQSVQNKIYYIDVNNLSNYAVKDILSTYLHSLYFSIVTFSTVGYGDFFAKTIIGKILVVIEIFFGVTMGASWASVLIKKMSR